MKIVTLVNGSLRGKKASSTRFLNDLSRRIDEGKYQKIFLSVKANYRVDYSFQMLEALGRSDAVVFVFPLYGYGLPGAMTRLLEDFRNHPRSDVEMRDPAKVYAIINCGFPRPEMTCQEAIRVVKHFCRASGFKWRFAISIGAGPVVAMTSRLPLLDRKLKRAFSALASDLDPNDKPVEDYFIRPLLPEIVIRKIKESCEKRGRMIVDRGSVNSTKDE